jgi:hypothetical protein
VSLTDRDKKVVMVVVPLVALLAYWFLLLSPQRKEAATAGTELSKQQDASKNARAQLAQMKSAKVSFASDYSQLVRLGKAIPRSVDMPSLIVQLDRAARGTGIKFRRIATGQRSNATPTATPASGGSGGSASSGSGSGGSSGSGSGSSPSSGSGGASPAAPAGGAASTPVAAGGEAAQSGPGKATESANNASAASNQSTAKSGGETVTPQDAQTSQNAKPGGLPVGGGGPSGPAGAAGGTCAPGLECVPLEFEFEGRFFNLADFFHRLKRFVAVANDKVLVDGRLLTIDGLKFSSGEIFPRLKAEITATVYLAPKSEGVTAGATPQGPAPATTTPAAAGSGQQSGSAQPPTGTSGTTPTSTATK